MALNTAKTMISARFDALISSGAMKAFVERHPVLVGLILVVVILNGFIVNSDAVGLGHSETAEWIGIISGFGSIAADFCLLALLITQAKKRRPPINIDVWEQSRKTGKWTFALRRTLPAIPLLIIGLLAGLFINGGELSFYVVRNYVVVIVVLAAGIFFISAAIWDNHDAEYSAAKQDSAHRSKDIDT
jgi:uncharacterized membrane protein